MNDKVGLKRGTVVLKKHHDEWAKTFYTESESLKNLFGKMLIDIQHIGSTAVPELSAKPIIDMLAAVRSFSDIEKMREKLEKAGYEYRGNGSDDKQVLFAKGPEEKRTHYLHIAEFGSSVWRNDLAFRDYLRVHPEEAQRYEKLKQDLAMKYADKRELYTAGKKDYIESVLKKVT